MPGSIVRINKNYIIRKKEMYKLIITNTSNGILLWAGVGSNEEILKTYGENWADENGLLKTDISYKATYLQVKQQTPFPGSIMSSV